jgi:hypothetical protein
MPFFLFKTLMTIFSGLATFLSLVFMAFPPLFGQIEEFVSLQFGGERKIVSLVEGEINFLDDWLKRNRLFFGPLFSVLAALNTRNIFFL